MSDGSAKSFSTKKIINFSKVHDFSSVSMCYNSSVDFYKILPKY